MQWRCGYAEMDIKPIAHFRSPFPEKFGIPRQAGLVPELRGRIEFEPEFRSADAVRGLEGFGYIWLIWGFSGNIPENEELSGSSFRATVRPPRLGGNERIGVFASRSPFRPNGLGLSSVKMESISDGPVINVLGADLMDGTPIYDIKPYLPYTDSHPEAASGFVDEKEWKELEVDFPQDLKNLMEPSQAEALAKVLEQDPRPKCSSPEKEYGMSFMSYDVKFKVRNGILSVTEVSAG